MRTGWLLALLLTCFLFLSEGRDSERNQQISIKAALRTPSHVSPGQSYNLTPFDHCETSLRPPSPTIPEYIIDLDCPPKERWKELITDKRKEIVVLIEHVKKFCDVLFGHTLFWMVEEFMPRLADTLPAEYREEFEGIALITGMNFGEVVLFNVFYEFFSLCTSIVARSDDGVLYHGRNLDFGLFLGWDPVNHTWQTATLLKPLVVSLNFIQGNKTLYRAINYAGYTGILTAINPGKFALTVDERFTWDGGYVGIAEWILGDRNQQWMGFLTRQVMETCGSYSCAQKKLSKPPLVAPVYFILSGTSPTEGCVITRGRNNFDIWPLGERHENQTGDWFLVQTNFDHWKKPSPIDNRRSPAVKCMDQLGNKDVPGTLSNVLSTRPVLNKLTTYTSIMSAEKHQFRTWIQSCPDPCWPW